MSIDVKQSVIEMHFQNGKSSVTPLPQDLIESDRPRFQFKNEIIVSESKKLLASELLLSQEDAAVHTTFMKGKLGKRLAKDILEQQLHFLIYVNPASFPFKCLFLNVERHALCSQKTINLLIAVHFHLKCYGKSLVVETTERQYSIEDRDYLQGVTKLKEVGVELALDDYQVGDDFRDEELSAGLYDYVKVDNPFFDLQADVANKKLAVILQKKSSSDAKWIVERVEDQNSLNHLLPYAFWGYQGYLFNPIQAHYPEYSLF
ncbi:EAL domain-containing protein [Vibrio sp. S9_S30]|uniref:EAL domain-containing protein n=1 Tax=Vibrio sp. S9_S30 TaxID=2720226 RepID=UPI0016800119|nr:EAL domain-containing protein [Vibrio sp. S9_S30]MBD1556370.1 EAL domain-containing protein [Vibrio sp. S9_S30]